MFFVLSMKRQFEIFHMAKMLKLSESRKNKMSLGIQVADKRNDFYGINDQIFATRNDNCDIYNTNATCKRYI